MIINKGLNIDDGNSSWEKHNTMSSHQLSHSAEDSDSGFHGQFRSADSPGGQTPSNSWKLPSQG